MVARIISRDCDWDETATYITRTGAIEAITNDVEHAARRAPSYHLVLSWKDDVTDAHALETASQAIALLGLADHRWMAAVHRDTDHPHIHVLAERAHPTTGHVWRGSFDAARMYRFVQEYNGGPLYPTDVIHGRERQFEFWSGQQSFARYVYTVLHPILEDPNLTWDALHRALADHAITINHTDRGAWFSDASATRSIAIRASRAGAALPLLERRLGPWRPCPSNVVMATNGYSKKLSQGMLLAPWVDHDPKTARLYELFRTTHRQRLHSLAERAADSTRRCERHVAEWDDDLREAKAILACTRIQPSIRAGIHDAMVISFHDERHRRRKELAGELAAKSRHLRHFQRWLRERSTTGDAAAIAALARVATLSDVEVRDLSGDQGRKDLLMDLSPAIRAIIDAPMPPPAHGAGELEARCADALRTVKGAINHAGTAHAAALDEALSAYQARWECHLTNTDALRLALAVASEAGIDTEILRECSIPIDVEIEQPQVNSGSITAGPQSRPADNGHRTVQHQPDDAQLPPPDTIEPEPQPARRPLQARSARGWFFSVNAPDDIAPIVDAYLHSVIRDRRIAQAVATLEQRQTERTTAYLDEAHSPGDRLIATATCRYLDRLERAHLNRYILLNAKPFAETIDHDAAIEPSRIAAVQRTLEQRFDATPEERLRELPRDLVRHKDSYHWKQRQAGFTAVSPEEIQIHNSAERESAVCALLLAYESFGKSKGMTLNGSSAFKREMVQAAVELGIEDAILNKECERDIVRARDRHAKAMQRRVDTQELRYGPTTMEQALRDTLDDAIITELLHPHDAASEQKISGALDAVLTPCEDAAYLILDKGTKRIIMPVDHQHVNSLRGHRHVSMVAGDGVFVPQDMHHTRRRDVDEMER